MRSEYETSHAERLATIKSLPQPRLTCWPVLTEAAFLLRHNPQQLRELLATADGRFLRILPLRHPDVLSINAIPKNTRINPYSLRTRRLCIWRCVKTSARSSRLTDEPLAFCEQKMARRSMSLQHWLFDGLIPRTIDLSLARADVIARKNNVDCVRESMHILKTASTSIKYCSQMLID